MSKDTGITFDGFSDKWIKETQNLSIINDLWNNHNMKILNETFKGRLILLNKVWPDIPKKDEFRPIIIMSPIYKYLEMRFADKLQSYLINHMNPN